MVVTHTVGGKGARRRATGHVAAVLLVLLLGGVGGVSPLCPKVPG